MKSLTWQIPGQHFAAQELIKIIINYVAELRFNKVKQGLLNKWNGMKASKAATVQIDGVTGATFSSKTVKENVKRGIDYYQKHK